MNDQLKAEAYDNQDLTWSEMVGSTMAAAFGVQSRKNKIRDFSHGEIKKFVVVAIAFTLFLLLVLIGIVQLVLLNVT